MNSDVHISLAVQLCLLRHPGRPLRQGEIVPRNVVEFVASQIGADPNAFSGYAGGPEGTGRDTTRREHPSEIVRIFGFRAFDATAYRELSRWLQPIAGAPTPARRSSGPFSRRCAAGRSSPPPSRRSSVWRGRGDPGHYGSGRC